MHLQNICSDLWVLWLDVTIIFPLPSVHMEPSWCACWKPSPRKILTPLSQLAIIIITIWWRHSCLRLNFEDFRGNVQLCLQQMRGVIISVPEKIQVRYTNNFPATISGGKNTTSQSLLWPSAELCLLRRTSPPASLRGWCSEVTPLGRRALGMCAWVCACLSALNVMCVCCFFPLPFFCEFWWLHIQFKHCLRYCVCVCAQPGVPLYV